MGTAAQGVARGGARRRPAVFLAVLTASVLLALAAPAEASAASGAADTRAAAPCPGRKVRTLTFPTGAVRIYRSGEWICAFTVQKDPGGRQRMSVSVQARGHYPVRRARTHAHTSPPVRVYAGHRCVWVRGAVGSRSVSSGWILC